MSDPLVAMFFSHGVSLAAWRKGGLLSREVSYYRALSGVAGGIVFVTYDTPGPTIERDRREIEPIEVVYNSWRLPYRLFGLLAPFLHYRTLRRAAVLKTNQLSGAWTAVLAKWVTRRPLVVRCGYVRSRNAALAGVRGLRLGLIVAAERLSVRNADLVFVATDIDREYVAARHGIPDHKFRHVPTPIDVDRFSPDDLAVRDSRHVLCVGRLSAEKNIDVIIDSCRLANARLTIIGAGALESDLRKRADPGRVTFLGNVANEEVVTHLRRCSVFVLASRFEGSPKALLEAMACGAPVVASDIPAVRRIVEDGENGIVAQATPDAFASAIERLLSNPELATRLGRAARNTVVNGYSQSEVARWEASYLASLR